MFDVILILIFLMGNNRSEYERNDHDEKTMDEKTVLGEKPFMMEDLFMLRSIKHRSICALRFLDKRM
jgi:hypothetical protein